MNILIIAPHTDDEVLGAGGTLARFAEEGAIVTVAVVTSGYPPEFPDGEEAAIREEAARAHAILKVAETVYLEFPAAALDTVEHRVLNRALHTVYSRVQPDYLFVPFAGDVHLDHQLVFNSAMVMCRPNGGHVPRSVLAYETLSETNWYAPPLTPGFVPNTYVDISGQLDRKLLAFGAYSSQVRPFPHERSIEALKALATFRGSTVGLAAAEGFVGLRTLI